MNRALFFDFDGVVLDSVEVKTKAFYDLFLPHGEDIAQKAVDYHIAHGGISRYEKFKYYYKNFLNRDITQDELNQLGDEFSRLVFEKVLESEFIKGFPEFIKKVHKEYDCYVVSGTPETELLEIVKGRNLVNFFLEVKGSPETKTDILNELLGKGDYSPAECFFFGDASTDLKAAKNCTIPFVLVRSKDNKNLEAESDHVITDFTEVNFV